MSALENQPSLLGKSVVITRPAQQNEFLRQRLTELGANAILFPCIEIHSVECSDALAALPVDVDDIDTFIFVSSNAVQYAFTQIPKLHQNIVPGKNFAAIGQATAQALNKLGVQQVLAPDQGFDSEGLLNLPAMNKIQDQSVLIIKGTSGRTELYDTLMTRKANVHTLDVYQRQLPRNNDPAVLTETVDAILFSSSESVVNMLKMLPAGDCDTVLQSQTIAGHARIGAKVTSLGFKKLPIIAANPSDAEMLTALIGWANRTENHNEH